MGVCLLPLLLSSLLLARIVSNHAWPSLALNNLSPPPGNSLLLKLKTHNGKQSFKCFENKWKLIDAAAELVDAGNLTRAGSYRYSHRNHSAGSWLLSNSPEEYAESGYPASEVSGVEVASEETSQEGWSVLAEAIEHRYTGKASLISYIQVFSTKARIPVGGNCSSRASELREVPLESEYWLWTQDRIPPIDTPAELLVPHARLVEGFFAKGVVRFVYNGYKWTERERAAMLYDVPGGDLVGQHYMQADSNGNSSNVVWELYTPNGFGVSGTLNKCQTVQVAENCMPWSLFEVTNSWGDLISLGPLSHVQMVSTRGGVPPTPSTSPSPSEPSETLTPAAAVGGMYNSSFSSLFWFYSK